MTKKSKCERKKPIGVRVHPDQLALAKYHKLDLASLFRKALETEILKREGRCPTCGNDTNAKEQKDG